MVHDLFFPLLLLALLAAAEWKRLALYDLFVKGAGEGLRTAVSLLPNLAAMLCAVQLMQASGLMDALCRFCEPAVQLLGLPAEVSPLILLRPVSGSASLAMTEQLIMQYGADSRIGLIACTVMGSSETVFYTVCIYMSAIGEKKTGYAIPCALLGALAGVWTAGWFY